MTALAPPNVGGTHRIGDTGDVVENPGGDASYRSAPSRRYAVLSEGTKIVGVWSSQKTAADRGGSATHCIAKGISTLRKSVGIGHYQVQTIAFPSNGVEDPIDFQDDFDRLAAELKSETAHFSSSNMIAGHPAFQAIVGMGREAIPLILRDLNDAPVQWFQALRAIARESPVRPEDRGNVEAMTAAWLDWGKRRFYIEP